MAETIVKVSEFRNRRELDNHIRSLEGQDFSIEGTEKELKKLGLSDSKVIYNKRPTVKGKKAVKDKKLSTGNKKVDSGELPVSILR